MQSPNILIVEDDPIIATLIEFRLKKLGFGVFAKARNETETLDSMGNGYPDLIFMDIHLNGEMDGIMLAKKISRIKKIPIVYLTAHADEETVIRAKETNPSGFIIKPFNDDDLRISIALALDAGVSGESAANHCV